MASHERGTSRDTLVRGIQGMVDRRLQCENSVVKFNHPGNFLSMPLCELRT